MASPEKVTLTSMQLADAQAALCKFEELQSEEILVESAKVRIADKRFVYVRWDEDDERFVVDV